MRRVLVPVSVERKVFPGAKALSSRIVRAILKNEMRGKDRGKDKGRIIVTVNFISDSMISRLNRIWKKRSGPTDILSFNFNEQRDEGFFLGEIYISVDTLARQARKVGHLRADELVVLLIHGTLHLLGHEHNEGAKRKAMMVRKENFYRAKLGRRA